MAGPVCFLDRGVEINGVTRWIDDRRAGDAEWSDVAARQGGARNRSADSASPQLLAALGVEGLDDVVLARRQQDRARCGRAPSERLGVEVTGDAGVEAAIEMNRAGLFPGQRRHDEIAAARGIAVIRQHTALLGDGAIGSDAEERGGCHDCKAGPHGNPRLEWSYLLNRRVAPRFPVAPGMTAEYASGKENPQPCREAGFDRRKRT